LIFFSLQDLNSGISFESRNAITGSSLFQFFPESQVVEHDPEKLPGRFFRDFLAPAVVVLARLGMMFRVMFPGFLLFLRTVCITGP
jgi:hypothetical protein